MHACTALSLVRSHILKSRLAQPWPPCYARDEASFHISCKAFYKSKNHSDAAHSKTLLKKKSGVPPQTLQTVPCTWRAEPARHFMRASSFRLSAQNLYVKTLSDSPLSAFCGHTFSNLVSRSHGLRPMLEMKQGTLQIQKSKRCPPFKIHFRGTSEKQKWRAPTNTTDRPKSFRNQNVDSWW